jgi:hypothetical protein
MELVAAATTSRRWLLRPFRALARHQITSAIKDPELRRKLTPRDELGCKRVMITERGHEIRAMVRQTGLDLPEELMRQFIAAWPAYEAMVRRIPRNRAYAEEPAHAFRPARVAGNAPR